MPESYARYIARLEEQHERACQECADRNGHTQEQADECDDGCLACVDCPFEVEKKDAQE
jgi:hypothetical protein